jgi:hypothetical protein
MYAPGETHFFEDVWSRKNEIGDLNKDNNLHKAANRVLTLFCRFNFPESQKIVDSILNEEALVERTKALGADYKALYSAFTGLLIEQEDKTYFCDDTPKHIYYLNTIFELYPSAKVLGCVRDPRDFLSSYKFYWQRSTESQRIKALYHPIITSILWRSSANLLIEHSSSVNRQRMLIISYEKLVTSPELEVKRICEFLDIEFTDDLLDVSTNNSSFINDVGGGIYTTSIGRWRDGLDPHETWWIQTLARKTMRAFNYKPEPVFLSWTALIRSIVSMPIVLLHAFRVNRQKRGPLASYISRRLSSFLAK